LRVGQLLPLRTHSYDLVSVESGGEVLFRAKLGQANDKFIIIIESAINQKGSVIEEIAHKEAGGE
jgi:flagellar motor switch protein FliM